MVKFVSVFGGVTGYGPFNSQERQESTQVVMRKPVCQHLKWTDEMVKVLITAVSYVEEDAILPEGLKNGMNCSFVPIKGKWKAISKTMVEKGFLVSPQQCEDKFNDLNKKYKRLNDILGKGTACEIVKNQTRLEFVKINEEAREEVLKLLGKKQLFYREMCSLHNKNKKYLPHDELLQKSVQVALKGKVKRGSNFLASSMPAKRQKQGERIGVSESFEDYAPTNVFAEWSNVPLGDVEGVQDQNQWVISHSLEMEEMSMLIKNQMLELEKNKIEREKRYMKLHRMKVKNESLKVAIERLDYMLKCQKRGFDSKLEISRSLEMEEKSMLKTNQMIELEKDKIEREKRYMELHRLKVENVFLKQAIERLGYMLRCQKRFFDSKL